MYNLYENKTQQKIKQFKPTKTYAKSPINKMGPTMTTGLQIKTLAPLEGVQQPKMVLQTPQSYFIENSAKTMRIGEKWATPGDSSFFGENFPQIDNSRDISSGGFTSQMMTKVS